MMIDYQEIVTLCAECISIAAPVGFIFGITGKALNMFLGLALGKERVRM